MSAARPPPAVAATLAAWHRMIASGDMDDLPALVHPAATFRSPMTFKPYDSADALILVVRTAFGVFRNFTYLRTLFSDDGLSVVLEFSAAVNDKQLKGIDLIRFDEQGKIVEFEVMVRPLSGLQALGEEMGKRLAGRLAAFKTAPIGPG